MGELEGRVIVVTGASRGLGRAVAVEAGRRSATVLLVARSTAASPHRVLPGVLEDAAHDVEAAGGRALTVTADLAKTDELGGVIAAAEGLGGCDVLINNAAYSTSFGSVFETTNGQWATAWAVNVMAPVALVRSFVPEMIRRGSGHVINISSGTTVAPAPNQGAYAVTKSALERFGVELATELETTPVDVLTIRIEDAIPTEAYRFVSKAIGFQPALSKVNSPEQLAAAICDVIHDTQRDLPPVLTLAELRSLGFLTRPTIDLREEHL